MADYPIGGGGGPAGFGTANDGHALDRQYDIFGDWTPDMANQLNEMIGNLFISATKNAAAITALQNVPAAVSATQVWTTSTFTLTELEIESLFTSPKTIITAPGAGLTVVIGSFTLKIVQSVAYGSNPSFQVFPQGSGAAALVTAMTSDLNNARDKFFWRYGIDASVLGVNVAAYTNKPIELSLSADPTTPGTGVATGSGSVVYRIAAI